MRSFTITPADDGTRLSRYVEKAAPGLPKGALYKAIRNKRIKRNGKRCDAADKLAAGDVLELWLTDDCFEKKNETRPDFLSASGKLDLLYEDENVAVLYKPVGVNSHPAEGDYTDNLVARFLRYLYEKGEYVPDRDVFTPALCNRLDRNTDGLVIAGKTREAAAAVNELIREDRIVKKYRCVCCGKNFRDGVYTAFHVKGSDNLARISDRELPGYKEIRTGFRTLKSQGELSYLEVTLFTGRTHQIRAHLAHLGAPILGDPKYGKTKYNSRYCVKSQCLTAYSVTFDRIEEGPLTALSGKCIHIEGEPYADLFD